jgi:hypothetical protein
MPYSDSARTAVAKYLQPCAPAFIYVVIAIILALIGFIYAVYYGSLKSAIFSFMSVFFWIALVGIILTTFCNVDPVKFPYAEIVVWVIVLVLLGLQICGNTSFVMFQYKNNNNLA